VIGKRKPETSAERLRRAISRKFESRINREPSPTLANSVPWMSVVFASLVPMWFVIASAPVLPPLGFLTLLAWRQLRPGLLPIWAGLPLGLFDDLVSGQPMGSAVLLWSVTMILTDLIEARVPWRNFAMEWLVAAAFIAAYILLGLVLANSAGGNAAVRVIIPQVSLSILVYPILARGVAGLDRFRLLPIRNVAS
jgi:rod shape-determining protein MreD